MTRSIILVIIAFILAVAGIIINPKKDKDESIFKPRLLGYLMIFILLIFVIIQIWQICDDNQSSQNEKSQLIAKYRGDSIYQQKELVDRNILIQKNERIIRLQDTTLNQQKYIVELQKDLIQKFRIENQQTKKKLASIQDETKRSNYKIKPVMDIAVFIPLEDYSFNRNTKYRIPSIKSYYILNKDTIFRIGPDMDYFTDSLCLSILKNLYGPNLLIELNVFKPDNPKSMWINAAYKVQLVEKDTTNGFKIAANWYANLFEELKDKSDRKNYRTNFGIAGEDDIWKLRVNLYNVPIGIKHIYPDLSLIDFTEIGTKYEIQLNSKHLNYDYRLTIKGEYNNYMSKLVWNSYPVEDIVGGVYGSSPNEQIKTKSIALYDTNTFWLPVGIP